MTKLMIVVAAGLLAVACSENKNLSVTGVEPETGDSHGGERVNITGTGFGTQGFAVYFGKRKAQKCSRSAPTTLTCETPGGKAGEKVDVQVVFDDSREATIKNAYTYIEAAGMGFTDKKPGETPPPAPPK